MLQIKEIPPRPVEYDGLLCLGGVPKGTTETKIKEALQDFGAIESCTAPKQTILQHQVKFTAHEAAEQVVAKAPKREGLYDYAFLAFNSRPYDDIDSDGEGRGW